MDDDVAHNLLGHLRVAERQQSPPIWLCGIDLMCLFALGAGGGLREEAARPAHGTKPVH